MNRFLSLIALCCGALLSGCSNSTLDIVSQGEANSVIVVPAEMTDMQQFAVDDFVHRVCVSTGVTLPVVSVDSIAQIDDDIIKINLVEESPDGEALDKEEFRIVAKGGDLYVCGVDLPRNLESLTSRVTMWAFSYIMEEYMNVEWLWPGELGTVTPKMSTISLPANIDYREQPKLVRRRFSTLAESNRDLAAWCARYQVTGERVEAPFYHSFRKGQANGDWWGDFVETQPDMLAKDPDGKPGYYNNNPEFYKVCVSNPKVVDEVIRKWKLAGSPDFWDLTPNDGKSFCTCDNCRALDLKYGGEMYEKEDIWRGYGHVSLSGRYVWFWNQVITRMREINPKTMIGVFLYSNYLYPPKNIKVKPGVIGELVPGFHFEHWQQWLDAGVDEIALRPNWWHMGGCAPHSAIKKQGYYIEQARKHNMHHVFFDTILEYWATQGLTYYVSARLINDFDVTTEQAYSDYCNAFAGTSEQIREYFDYWEDYHTNVVAYTVPIGGGESQNKDGLYESVCRKEFGFVQGPLNGHWLTIPYMYPDDVKQKAREILDRATVAAGDDSLTAQRVDYLREGLNMLDRVSDYIIVDKNDVDLKAAKLQEVADYTKAMKRKFDHWGGFEIKLMQTWNIADKNANFSDM